MLQKIYERASQYPTFQGMIYFSDHGNDADNNLGHDASKFTDTMSHIPFFVFLSNQYVQNHQQKFITLQKHQNSFWSNDLAFDLMVDLFGIQGMPHDLKFDLASKQYGMTKDAIRTLHGSRNVDGN